MTDAPQRKPQKGSAVIAGGTYRIERQVVWLRPPVPAAAEPAPAADPESLAPRPEETAIVEPPPGPTPEELAREEAERLLGEARREADGLRREAREQGYADGVKEGHEAGRLEGRDEALRELRATLDRWLALGDALSEAWRRRFYGVEEEARELSVATAEQLVRGHLALKPESILDVVRDCLRHAADADQITVLVSPKDVAILREAREDLVGVLKSTGRFEIVEEAKMEAGSCVVETRTQVIDATRATRVDQIKGQLRGGPGGPG